MIDRGAQENRDLRTNGSSGEMVPVIPSSYQHVANGEMDGGDSTPAPDTARVWRSHFNLSSSATHVIESLDAVPPLDERTPTDSIVLLPPLNECSDVNGVLRAVSRGLRTEGLLGVSVETLHQRKSGMMRRYPRVIFLLRYMTDFLFRRVLPKLIITRWFYRLLAERPHLVLTETEALGRLVYCGFTPIQRKEVGGRLYLLCEKKREPSAGPDPAYGFLLRLERLGQHGKPMRVFKLRTMYPYAEFIQGYVYERNNLTAGGKFNNDFRITGWGRYLRRLWLDELPMLLNWLRGDVKLVGVRPLSRQYAGLYPPEFWQRRLSAKPGLVPPFYADLPETFADIVASERVYLEAYAEAPWRTDVRYLFRALWNILVRRARSR